MNEYVLYLDESSRDDENFLSVGGFIIKKTDVSILREKMNDVRKLIWDEDYIKSNNPILHSTELNRVYKNRSDTNSSIYITHEEYRILAAKQKDEISNIYKDIYAKLCVILKKMDITILGCVIDKSAYNYLYSDKYVDDYYNIAIETIIENYIHFLDGVNGVGSIIYESRNSPFRNDAYSPDVRMYNNFCSIKTENKGMKNLSMKSTLFRLRDFSFQRKSGDGLCLAFADFVVYNMSKMQHIKELDNRTEFMKKLYDSSYNGNFLITDKDVRDYFGIKVLPIDMNLINNLKIENRKIKSAIKNYKYDIRKLSRKNKQLIDEKGKLKEKLKTLEDVSKTSTEMLTNADE